MDIVQELKVCGDIDGAIVGSSGVVGIGDGARVKYGLVDGFDVEMGSIVGSMTITGGGDSGVEEGRPVEVCLDGAADISDEEGWTVNGFAVGITPLSPPRLGAYVGVTLTDGWKLGIFRFVGKEVVGRGVVGLDVGLIVVAVGDWEEGSVVP